MSQKKEGKAEEALHPKSEVTEASNLKGDYGNYALLMMLYIIQGKIRILIFIFI